MAPERPDEVTSGSGDMTEGRRSRPLTGRERLLRYHNNLSRRAIRQEAQVWAANMDANSRQRSSSISTTNNTQHSSGSSLPPSIAQVHQNLQHEPTTTAPPTDANHLAAIMEVDEEGDESSEMSGTSTPDSAATIVVDQYSTLLSFLNEGTTSTPENEENEDVAMTDSFPLHNSPAASNRSSAAPSDHHAVDPIGYPDPGYNPAEPFDFKRLPRSIRYKIFTIALSHSDPIHPIQDAITRGQPLHGEGSSFSSITAAMLPVSKQFYIEASEIFYGFTRFIFQEPKTALWWFKRIGSNVPEVKNVTLLLGSGFYDPSKTPKERVWIILLNFLLKAQYRLTHLTISFQGWGMVDHLREWPDKEDVEKARYKVIHLLLLKFHVENTNVEEGLWFGQGKSLELAMTGRENEMVRAVKRLVEGALGMGSGEELPHGLGGQNRLPRGRGSTSRGGRGRAS